MFFGTVSGGLSAELTGGNFWQGAATGLTVSALNHVAHRSDAPDNGYERDGNGGYKQVDINGGDIIDYLYDENGNIVDRRFVYTMEYETYSTNSSGLRTFGYKGVPVYKEYSSVPQGGHALIDPTGDIVYGYAGGLAFRGLGIAWKGFVRYTGFPKQWFRFGKSYSHTLDSKTYLSLRWGAGGDYWKKNSKSYSSKLESIFQANENPNK
jgi:hypothetical protein